LIKCFGVVYRFHPLFVIMMALSVVTGYYIELLTLFGIVVIHELGHVVAAKYYEWEVTEVQLLPFGGVAVIDEQGNVTAWEEIVVALAGPLQNALMIIFALMMKSTALWSDGWVDYFVQANMWIALFNLLPILPLDGGRVLQALLSYRISYYYTLKLTLWMSLVMSGALLSASIYNYPVTGLNLNLLVIALFLLATNWYSYRNLNYKFMRFLLGRSNRADKILSQGGLAQPIVVLGELSVAHITKMFRREKYHLIYVLNENGTIRAVVPEHRLIHNIFIERRPISAVSELFM
jgi:stage IV sporulation protein FB